MIRRILKEARFTIDENDYKDIISLHELVEYLNNKYKIDNQSDLIDDVTAWQGLLPLNDCYLPVEAHTDDNGDTWFGVSDVESYLDTDFYSFAESYNYDDIKEYLQKDCLTEFCFERMKDFLSYMLETYIPDEWSKELELPCNKIDIDHIIETGSDRVLNLLSDAAKKLKDEIISYYQPSLHKINNVKEEAVLKLENAVSKISELQELSSISNKLSDKTKSSIAKIYRNIESIKKQLNALGF